MVPLFLVSVWIEQNYLPTQRKQHCNHSWDFPQAGSAVASGGGLAALRAHLQTALDSDPPRPFRRPHGHGSRRLCQHSDWFPPFFTQEETFLVATFFFPLAKQFFFLPAYSFCRQLATMAGFWKSKEVWWGFIFTVKWARVPSSLGPDLSCSIPWVRPALPPRNCHFPANSPSLIHSVREETSVLYHMIPACSSSVNWNRNIHPTSRSVKMCVHVHTLIGTQTHA